MLQRFKFMACDFAEAHAVARSQKCGRIFFGIKQAQGRATDEVPAPGRTQGINSSLRATNSDGTGRNFFPRSLPARRGQLLRKTSQKWKSGNKSYAGDTILSRAVKTDDFT